MKSKIKGMTLIEVLIASVLIFIAISALSFTTQNKIFADSKLQKSIKEAYIWEQVQGVTAYSLEFENKTQGRINDAYSWEAKLQSSRPVIRSVDIGSEQAVDGTLMLYRISIYEQKKSKVIIGYDHLIWQANKS